MAKRGVFSLQMGRKSAKNRQKTPKIHHQTVPAPSKGDLEQF